MDTNLARYGMVQFVKRFAFLLLLAVWASPLLAASSGEAVYQKRCAVCHEQVNDRIPPREALQKMPSARILRALDAGPMMAIAFTISREDRMAVASYLGTNAPVAGPPACGVLRGPQCEASRQPKSFLERMEPRRDQCAVSAGRFGPIEHRSGARAQVEMGFWLRWGRDGVRAAHGYRWPGVRRKRRRAGPRHARRDGLPAMGVSGEWTGAVLHSGGAARQPARIYSSEI